MTSVHSELMPHPHAVHRTPLGRCAHNHGLHVLSAMLHARLLDTQSSSWSPKSSSSSPPGAPPAAAYAALTMGLHTSSTCTPAAQGALSASCMEGGSSCCAARAAAAMVSQQHRSESTCMCHLCTCISSVHTVSHIKSCCGKDRTLLLPHGGQRSLADWCVHLQTFVASFSGFRLGLCAPP